MRRGAVEEIAQRLRAQTIVVAMEDRRQGLPLESLLALRTRGGRVLDDVSFAEAALQRLPLVPRAPERAHLRGGLPRLPLRRGR